LPDLVIDRAEIAGRRPGELCQAADIVAGQPGDVRRRSRKRGALDRIGIGREIGEVLLRAAPEVEAGELDVDGLADAALVERNREDASVHPKELRPRGVGADDAAEVVQSTRNLIGRVEGR
jgi:hypothetical protein